MANYLFPKRENAEQANEVHEISFEQIKDLIRDNRKEEKEGIEMTRSSYRGEHYVDDPKYGQYGLYKDYVERDTRTAGLQIYYPHGIIISQPQRRNYYRGENAIYPSSVPSLLRKLRIYKNKEDQEQYRLVADMRIYEFQCLLDRFEQTAYWKKTYGDVLYDVLAQHYGLETCWLDITSNLEVALFFANCYFKDDQWYPITEDWIDKQIKEHPDQDPDNFRHGMIFHMPSYMQSSRMSMEIYQRYPTVTGKIVGKTPEGNDIYERLEHPIYRGEPGNVILPVGYQPYERSRAQNAYAIYMRDERPLQKDDGFEKLSFRHNDKLANWIYEKMDGGKKIYPYDGLSDCDFIIKQIQGLTQFSRDALHYAVYRSHYFKLSEIDEVEDKLKTFSVDGNRIEIIERHPWRLSSGRRKRIDYGYRDFCLENWYGIHMVTRTTYPGPQPVFEPWMLMTEEDEPGVIDFKVREKINCGFSFLAQDAMRLLKTMMEAREQDF